MSRWLLVAGDFSPLGGMDRANHALASFLVRRADDVTLVTHRAWDDLRASGARVINAARPFGSHLAGAPLLAAAGKRAATGSAPGTRSVVNGGNADIPDITWIHYLHAAHAPVVADGFVRRRRVRAAHEYFLRRERVVVPRARVVVCNSRRTARDVQQAYGVPIERLRVVYYGVDASAFAPITPGERAAARSELGLTAAHAVLFVGALNDRRKGFDRLFEAWRTVSRDTAWDVDLVVAGTGGELHAWRQRAEQAGMTGVHFLGFRPDIARVMAACDAIIHPARYEAYGLGVHEAICRGLPAIVSRHAGVAELFPEDLDGLLIDDVENAAEVAERIRKWRRAADDLGPRVEAFSSRLRRRSWDDMATEFVSAVTT